MKETFLQNFTMPMALKERLTKHLKANAHSIGGWICLAITEKLDRDGG